MNRLLYRREYCLLAIGMLLWCWGMPAEAQNQPPKPKPADAQKGGAGSDVKLPAAPNGTKLFRVGNTWWAVGTGGIWVYDNGQWVGTDPQSAAKAILIAAEAGVPGGEWLAAMDALGEIASVGNAWTIMISSLEYLYLHNGDADVQDAVMTEMLDIKDGSKSTQQILQDQQAVIRALRAQQQQLQHGRGGGDAGTGPDEVARFRMDEELRNRIAQAAKDAIFDRIDVSVLDTYLEAA